MFLKVKVSGFENFLQKGGNLSESLDKIVFVSQYRKYFVEGTF